MPRRPPIQRQRDVALARIAALEALLVCYRTGRQPPERLHRELARTKTAMDDAFEGFHPSSGDDRRDGLASPEWQRGDDGLPFLYGSGP